MSENILEVINLIQTFQIPNPDRKKNKSKTIPLHAVNDISFSIKKGETFGLVGESGSGKSTTGRAIIGLNRVTSGSVKFEGKEVTRLTSQKDKLEMCKNIQMIFQDPYASVNPRMTVEDIIGEGIRLHFPKITGDERRAKIIALLEKVGLSADHISRFPHEFSGGQLQRIGIARTLAIQPKLIIADEAISALDVSIQAQVVNLMRDLQDELGLTYLFIAHDLSMVKYISNKIGVMHRGRLVEIADANEIYKNPIHPYTKSLLSAIPHPDPYYEKNRTRIIYDSKMHDYEENKPSYHKISENHVVYCNDEELSLWNSR